MKMTKLAQMTCALNGTTVKIHSCSSPKKSQDWWGNLILLPQLPWPCSYKWVNITGQISNLGIQQISQKFNLLDFFWHLADVAMAGEKEIGAMTSKSRWMLYKSLVCPETELLQLRNSYKNAVHLCLQNNGAVCTLCNNYEKVTMISDYCAN